MAASWHILAVGKIKDGPEHALIAEYQKRLKGRVTITEIDVRGKTGAARIEAEGQAMEQKLPRGALILALDERGKTVTSRAFAQKLTTAQDRPVAFLIGGADGLWPPLRERADLILGFGAMTWPHRLCRVLLLEQLYRAQSLQEGHPYHRD